MGAGRGRKKERAPENQESIQKEKDENESPLDGLVTWGTGRKGKKPTGSKQLGGQDTSLQTREPQAPDREARLVLCGCRRKKGV